MNIIKSFSFPLVFMSVFGVMGCSSNDPASRSVSYTSEDVNIPNAIVANEATTVGGFKQLVSTDPVSTVNINVNSRSYGNLRRAINQGEWPATVRLADWLNYFSYDYPKPQGKAPFTAVAEIAPAPWNGSSKLMLVGVNSSMYSGKESPANNIVVLVDINKGMDSSAVVALIKKSLQDLTEQLRPQDRIAFVSYSSENSVVLESTTGDKKEVIKKAIGQIKFGHEPISSDTMATFNQAYTIVEQNMIAGGNNQLLLISDGKLEMNNNVAKTVEKTVGLKSEAGIALSALVFNKGTYNYQEMQRLADIGGGVHTYIDTLNEANRVITQQLQFGNKIIAQPVKLQVTFNPAYVKSYRLLGYEKNSGKTINQDKSSANAIKDGQMFTALYEIETIDNNITPELPHKYYDIGRVAIEYKQPSEYFYREFDLSIVPAQIKASISKASNDFTFASAVAALALKLKKEGNLAEYTIDDIIQLAKTSTGKDELGLRAEFVRLLESVKQQNMTL